MAATGHDIRDVELAQRELWRDGIADHEERIRAIVNTVLDRLEGRETARGARAQSLATWGGSRLRRRRFRSCLLARCWGPSSQHRAPNCVRSLTLIEPPLFYLVPDDPDVAHLEQGAGHFVAAAPGFARRHEEFLVSVN
jgi:hypothetical protein